MNGKMNNNPNKLRPKTTLLTGNCWPVYLTVVLISENITPDNRFKTTARRVWDKDRQ